MQTATTMNANDGLLSHPRFLPRVLLLDSAACLGSGLVMTLGAEMTARLTAIPTEVLIAAGASLFPIALFMTWVAMRRPTPVVGVWLVVIGNVGWVLGSFALLTGLVPFNALGAAFVTIQATAVAGLAALEVAGLRRL